MKRKEEFLRSSDGSETVCVDSEAVIRNLLQENRRLRAALWRENNDHYDWTADGDADWGEPKSFIGKRCPRCGTEAKVDVDKFLYCPNPTCAAYEKPDGTWTPGYGGET